MRTFILGEPPFAGSGEGVRIAVIDSGVNATNPHVGAVAGGVGIADDGSFHDDLVDRVGHGTAVVAAIQEKAPAAAIHVVRVFETSLTTRSENLVRAIDWAAGNGMHLANLSLGTANPTAPPSSATPSTAPARPAFSSSRRSSTAAPAGGRAARPARSA